MDPTLERALSRLEPTAHDRWPDTFAGLWITGETTDDEIYVAFTEDAERNVAALAEGFPYPRMLQAWTFERSLRELKTLQLGLLADRELAAEGELEIPGLPDGRFDLGTDVAQNRVMVTVEQLEPEPTAWFEERHGDDVVVEEGPPFVPE